MADQTNSTYDLVNYQKVPDILSIINKIASSGRLVSLKVKSKGLEIDAKPSGHDKGKLLVRKRFPCRSYSVSKRLKPVNLHDPGEEYLECLEKFTTTKNTASTTSSHKKENEPSSRTS